MSLSPVGGSFKGVREWTTLCFEGPVSVFVSKLHLKLAVKSCNCPCVCVCVFVYMCECSAGRRCHRSCNGRCWGFQEDQCQICEYAHAHNVALEFQEPANWYK